MEGKKKKTQNGKGKQDEQEADIEKELSECKEAKKAIEIKYQASLRELTSSNQARVERIFFNSSAEESLNDLRRNIELERSIISKLKAEVDRQKNEVEKWRNKFYDAEKQLSKLYVEGKRASGRTSSLEAENRALRERIRQMMNQSMNMSSASSIIDNRVPPPPPPVDVPSIDEFLRMSADQQYGSMEINSSVPPPPPVEAPFGDLLLQSRSGNRSVNSSYG